MNRQMGLGCDGNGRPSSGTNRSKRCRRMREQAPTEGRESAFDVEMGRTVIHSRSYSAGAATLAGTAAKYLAE